MGRPRKKQKLSEAEGHPSDPVVNGQPQPLLPQNSPDTSDQVIRGKDRYSVPCPQVYSQYLRTHQLGSQTSFPTEEGIWELQNTQNNNNDSDATPPSDSPPTPYLSYPTSMEMWPDYSTMSQLPQMVADNHEPPSDTSASISSASFESVTSLPPIPVCPCLPNLYLTLSTLSTIATFPVSNHTIESLLTATRTAHSVLYCAVCPQKFQSGMQNVMLLGTLLSVLADGWNRVRLAPAAELKKGFTNPHPGKNGPDLPLSPQESLSWRVFAHTLVRAHVFGDMISPTPFTLPDGSTSFSSCPFSCPKGIPITLSYLVEAMERRQKVWHEMHDDTREFPPRMAISDFHHQISHMSVAEKHDLDMERDGHLCIRIVKGAARVVRGLGGPPPTCADLGIEGHEHREECQICDGVVGTQFMAANLAPELAP